MLNRAVGGFNPAAVETALAYGAAEIWMPTLDAANHRRFHGGRESGLALEDGRTLDAIHDTMELIAQADVILGTGHLSVAEILLAVRVAHEHAVRKILITHPEAPFIDMPVSVQSELAEAGCRFERTWVFTTPALGHVVKPDRMIHDIKAVGAESTVLASDMGQVGNSPPVEGLRAYVRACLEAGFTEAEVRRMGLMISEWLP